MREILGVSALTTVDKSARGLARSAPGWLSNAYPELFASADLRDRLNVYDAYVELSLYAHHPGPEVREVSRVRLVRLLEGRNHLDALTW